MRSRVTSANSTPRENSKNGSYTRTCYLNLGIHSLKVLIQPNVGRLILQSKSKLKLPSKGKLKLPSKGKLNLPSKCRLRMIRK